MRERIVVVLGAGASRGVSYRRNAPIPSPLDSDYFDLLQRFDRFEKDSGDVENVLKWAQGLPFEYWRSMERCFYTIHSQAYLARKLRIAGTFPDDAEVVTSFVNATGALLRAAHGTRSCKFHTLLFKNFRSDDSIITFNYDLVPERSFKNIEAISSMPFGPWVYGRETVQKPTGWNAPWLLKLHGSYSWDYPRSGESSFRIRINAWEDLEEAPGFRRFGTVKTEFPIFLPFWDKKVEQGPWLGLWRKAFDRLAKCTALIVWGYSLPKTDLKAYQLFRLARLENRKLCVIDPSPETKDIWRKLLLTSKFWEYSSIEEFLETPPPWWR